jgi:hypothetical protein
MRLNGIGQTSLSDEAGDAGAGGGEPRQEGEEPVRDRQVGFQIGDRDLGAGKHSGQQHQPCAPGPAQHGAPVPDQAHDGKPG